MSGAALRPNVAAMFSANAGSLSLMTGPGDPYAASDADTQRRAAMTLAWKAYNGELDKPLKTRPAQPDDNVRVNRCGPVVDKGVSFLFGQDVTFTVEDPDSADDNATDAPGKVKMRQSALSAKRTPGKLGKASGKQGKTLAGGNTVTQTQQDWLDACLSGQDSPNDIMAFLQNANHNGGVCGHSFIKLVPAKAGQPYPRLVNLDPMNMRIITDPGDIDLILAYVYEWTYTDRKTGQKTTRRQVTEREDDMATFWTITEYVRLGDTRQAQFAQLGEPVIWPHAWSPIQGIPNLPNPNEAWGTPDLTPDLIDLNKMLSFVESNIARIIRFHAHPKTWAKGFNVSQLTTSADGIIGIPTKEGEIGTLEMHSDLASSMAFAEMLRGDGDERSRTPAVALGRQESLPKGNLSGVALELLFQPLMEKTGTKRRLWQNVLRQLCSYLLELGDFGNGIDVTVNWPQVLPKDPAADAQTAVIKQSLGVSKRTLVTEMGYDYDEELENNLEAAQAAQQMFSSGQSSAVVAATLSPTVATTSPTTAQAGGATGQEPAVANAYGQPADATGKAIPGGSSPTGE